MLGSTPATSRRLTSRMLMPRKQRLSRWCECGRRKSNNAAACNRCGYLDGQRDLTAFVIAALRTVGGLSLVELREMVYGPATTCRNPDRILLLVTQRLMACGRLHRQWRAVGAGELVDRGGWARGASGHWVYTLDDRAEAN